MGEVVGFSRQSRDDGNRYWGRISGTKYEAMTADWIGEKLSELGLENIHTQAFDLRPQWFPVDWSLSAIGDGTTLDFSSANPATRSPGIPGTMELEAVARSFAKIIDEVNKLDISQLSVAVAGVN